MNYKNAYEGIKKLVAAEALQIIGAGLAIIVAILGIAALAGAAAAADGSETAAAGAVASGAGVIILSLGIAVLGIISEILMLIGLKKASADEPQYFRSAFILAVVVLVAGIASAIPALGTMGSIIKVTANAASVGMFVCTVMGISKLAKEIGREDVVSMGNVIIVIEVIQLLLASIASFTNGILAVIAAIVSFIGYIIYLVYLTKGKKMLEQ